MHVRRQQQQIYTDAVGAEADATSPCCTRCATAGSTVFVVWQVPLAPAPAGGFPLVLGAFLLGGDLALALVSWRQLVVVSVRGTADLAQMLS